MQQTLTIQKLHQTAFIICIFYWMMWEPNIAVQATPTKLMEQQLQSINTQSLDPFWASLIDAYGSYFSKQDFPHFIDIITGKHEFSFKHLVTALLRYFLEEVWKNGYLLATLVLLTLFSILLETMQQAFEKHSVSKLGYALTFLVLMMVAMNSFRLTLEYAQTAISNMINFMVAMIPVLLSLMVSMGHITTVAVVHPLLIFMIHLIGTVITFVIFPLLFFSTILYVVSAMSEKYQLTALAQLLRQISMIILAGFITIFLSVISIQSATGAIRDGVMIRTAKYVTGNFIPIVGRLFADAAETVVGISVLVKHAIGISGVAIIAMYCLFPACKIIAITCMYHLSAAVIQPLGSHPMTTCLQMIGKSMMCIFATLAAIGLMFFLAITILIAMSHVAVMIR
jgi:stage III sporulation protein AE